jgi:superfamily II DNA/RNA helicase
LVQQSLLPSGHFTNRLADADHPLLRGNRTNVRAPCLRRIAPTERVSQKVELLFRQFADPRLRFIHRQLQLRHDVSHPSQRFFRSATAADHQVIGVVNDVGSKTLLVSEFLPSQHESPHVQVAEQRADRRELRRLKDEAERIDQLQKLLDACGKGPESKLIELEEWLKDLHTAEPNAKVIVFSEYADTVDVIVTHLEAAGYASLLVKLTGDISSRKERRAALSRFASAQARVLVATDVAGEGLNLQDHCHHLVHFELPWNPNRLEQTFDGFRFAMVSASNP